MHLRGSRSSLAAVVTVVAVLAACSGPPRQRTADPGGAALQAGDAVSFQLPQLDGTPFGSSALAGRPALLDFWATWCVPCRAQKRVIEDVTANLGEELLAVVAVNVGEDPERVRAFVEKSPSPFPVVLDQDESLADRLGLVALPTLMLVDAEGRLLRQVTGLVDARTLREMLAEAGIAMDGPDGGRAAGTAPVTEERRET